MRKFKGKGPSGTTLIGKDTVIEGTVRFQGTLHLNGKVDGTVQGEKGIIIVGKDAEVNADILVGEAVIHGAVTGSVVAGRKIEVHSPAKVSGDIKAPEISIGPGVIFNGNCDMIAPPDTGGDKQKTLENQSLTEDFKGKGKPKNL